MPGFTEVEKRIITKYKLDLELSRSLNSIREVMENIWAYHEIPRIVQDFTDHGEEHSQRVAYFAEKLLQINPDANFTQNEIYLLLAGIYLHDIGMQCDIVQYPELKTKAESLLGAEFNEMFTAKTTNEYSFEQQKEIRKNHHLLSAAWIDYLYEGKDPVLSHGIKSIPFDLVDDLMDVCKFHSKLSINDCPDYFSGDPNSRKKLVASLLRFADELDISSTRVKINTVKIFSVTLENSIYWWLHNYTNINFVDSNKVCLKVNLCPEDFKLYGSFVREDYVTNFKKKNKPVLDVLVEKRIPIIIDNKSDVVLHPRAEKFPPEITAVLDEKMKKTESSNSKIPSNEDPDSKPVQILSPQHDQKSKTTISNVPYSRNTRFTGREEKLKQIHETLLSDNSVAVSQPIAVYGLGGIGKTQTAIEYIYRYRAEYEYIFWVTADSEDLVISGYMDIANLLDLPVKNDSDQNLIVSAVLNWLKTNENWLLIFDNADEPSVLKNLMPFDPKGHVLLTSRAHFFEELDITNQIVMEKMTLNEAREFFIKRTERENLKPSELNALDELTYELDYLPLAIEQAGAYIRKIECSFEDYLSSYKTRGLKLLEKFQIVPNKYPKSVATTWILNFEQVGQISKASADILFVSAFLSPSQIPFDIFIKGSTELGPMITSALEDIENDHLVLDEVLEPLIQYSLITRDIDNHTYDIHRLVQAVIRDRINEDTQKLWAERVVKALNRVFPEVEYKNWELCNKLLPHAQTCEEYIKEWDLETEEAAELLNLVGNYLYQRASFQDCEQFFSHALAICENVFEPEHTFTATTLNNLAVLYRSMGSYEKALPLYQRALNIRKKVLGLEHPDVATSLNSLALLYENMGAYEKALPLSQRALDIHEKVLGPEHPDVATTLNNLAGLYRSMGSYEKALLLYQRAVKIDEEVLGPEHPNVATILNNLALLYENMRSYEKALPLYQRALDIREKVMGPEHPDIATTLNNLAGLYEDIENYEKALPLYQRALNIREKVLGPEHPDVATTLNNIAELYRHMGEYNKSLPLFQRALDISENVLGPEHLDVAITLNNIAALYDNMGEYDKALPLYQRALDIRENVFGPEHPDLATTLNNLAGLYDNMGVYDKITQLKEKYPAFFGKTGE